MSEIPDDDLPKKPFLAVMSTSGALMPIEQGAILCVVLDAKDPSSVFPLHVQKIGLKKWTFGCACMTPGCSRVITYACSMQGFHRMNNNGAQ